MSTQWHPLFAHLLSLLVDAYYQVDVEVPVSDLPRRGDILLLRRTGSALPPFEGWWSQLTDWNVLEFKGPTDDADESDLELLVHVGTGITYRFNEERRKRGEGPLSNHRIAFWYLARTLGETFLGAARLRTHLQYEGDGLWQGRVWGHPVFFINYQDAGAQADALPLHVLTGAPQVAPRTLAGLFEHHEDLWRCYGQWLQAFQPDLWKEIRHMVPTLPENALIDWEKVAKYGDITPLIQTLDPKRAIQIWGIQRAVDVIGLEQVLATVGPERVVEALGPERVVEALGPERVVELLMKKLTPEQLLALGQRFSAE